MQVTMLIDFDACCKTLLIELYNFVYGYRFSQEIHITNSNRDKKNDIHYQAYYLSIKGVLPSRKPQVKEIVSKSP